MATVGVFATLVSLATPAWAMHQNFEYNETWINSPYYGSITTAFADVTGDGQADAIAVNTDGIYVKPAGKCFFKATQKWTTSGFYSKRKTAFADVTGDGRADAIAVKSDGIYVRPAGTDSKGHGVFLAGSRWTAAYYGTHGTFFADVNGDKKADAIAVNDDAIYVRPSYGSGFYVAENWTAPDPAFYGSRTTAFADVNGDHYADAIAVNNDGIYVKLASKIYHFFNTTQLWTTDGPFFGTHGTFFGDVHDDGKVDAITANDDTTTVRGSDGQQFIPLPNGKSWHTVGPNGPVPFYGTRGTFFVDVTGDHTADAIAVNDGGVTVRRSAYLDGFWDGYKRCHNH